MIGLLLTAALAAPASMAGPTVEGVEERGYLAPGAQFGVASQELTLSIGRSTTTHGECRRDDVQTCYLIWFARGLRIEGVAHGWTPAAFHALAFVSVGARGWEWWPQGFEIAMGGGGNAARGYGLVQLSYIAGIASRFEGTATVQWPLGEAQPQAAWISRWLFGLRYGFDLLEPRRTKVTTVREP